MNLQLFGDIKIFMDDPYNNYCVIVILLWHVYF